MPANPSRLGLKIFVFLVIVAVAAVATVGFLRPVAKVATIAKGNAANVVAASVIIEPGVVSSLASEVDGRLVESKLSPGLEVKEGETLAQLDTADVDLEIARATTEHNAAKKSIEIAKTMSDLAWKTKEEELKETRRLYDLKSVAEVDWTLKQRDVEVAKQRRLSDDAENERKLESLKNTLDSAELKRKKMTILAPFDGVVTEVFVNRKDLVSNKQPLAKLIPHTRLVRARIPEEDFAAVQVGQKVQVSLLGYSRQTFEATIRSKLPTTEPGTQRYSAILDLNIGADKLVPGLTGDAAIYIDERKDVVVVPRRAVTDGFVLLVEDGRILKRSVELGYTDLNYAEVKQGLQVGAVVVLEELDRFRDGQRVRVEPGK